MGRALLLVALIPAALAALCGSGMGEPCAQNFSDFTPWPVTQKTLDHAT